MSCNDVVDNVLDTLVKVFSGEISGHYAYFEIKGAVPIASSDDVASCIIAHMAYMLDDMCAAYMGKPSMRRVREVVSLMAKIANACHEEAR